jgi:hypothetical protein
MIPRIAAYLLHEPTVQCARFQFCNPGANFLKVLLRDFAIIWCSATHKKVFQVAYEPRTGVFVELGYVNDISNVI